MKAYVTKWALSRGILEVDVFAPQGSNVAMLPNGDMFFRRDWFPTLKEAEADFERRKDWKLEEMELKMAALRAKKPRLVRAKGVSR